MITLALSTITAFTYWIWIVRLLSILKTLKVHSANHTHHLLGNLLFAEWLLPLSHLCDAHDESANRVVCCEWSDYVGGRWVVEGAVCEDQWL